MKVLLVEDNQELSSYIKEYLEMNHYVVEVAFDGDEALEMFYLLEGDYDLVILDLGLPGKIQGFDLLKKFREENPSVRVLILTGDSDTSDIVKGFNLGACDYMLKSLSFSELVARISALLRARVITKAKKSIYKFSDFTYDNNTLTLSSSSKSIVLTKIDAKLLKYFLDNIGIVLSLEDIIAKLWGNDDLHNSDYVKSATSRIRVIVSGLRHKTADIIKSYHITTVIGEGYVFEPSKSTK